MRNTLKPRARPPKPAGFAPRGSGWTPSAAARRAGGAMGRRDVVAPGRIPAPRAPVVSGGLVRSLPAGAAASVPARRDDRVDVLAVGQSGGGPRAARPPGARAVGRAAGSVG